MEAKNHKFISEAIRHLSPEDRKLVLVWSEEIKKIRDDQSLSKAQKVKKVYKVKTSKVVIRFLKILFKTLKINLWDKRSWPFRLTVGGFALGVSVAGNEAAGIAALGSAIGIKLYLLTAAGGALLGTIIEEIKKETNEKK